MHRTTARASHAGFNNEPLVLSAEPPRWFACRTRPRAEKRVEHLLAERGIEVYLPRIARERQWADRRRVVQFPLFPDYVFGRFATEQIHRVLTTPGVAMVVYHSGRPAPIRDAEIENLRLLARGLDALRQEPVPHPFRERDWVRVTDGPFLGLKGVVTQFRGRRHVVAGVRTLGQGIVLFIESGLLESITPDD